MKRHLIKIMTIGAVATMMLASCNKNNNGTDANAPEGGFRATTELDSGSDSKTYLVGTDVRWTADDLIKVANQSGAIGCDILNYQLTEGEGTTNGTFYTGEEHETFFTPYYVAAYPASQVTAISGSTVTFSVPATQTFNADHASSFGEKAMPMVACSENQTLHFKNVLGGISFPIKGEGLHVTKVTVTSKTSEALWGICTATLTGTGYDATFEEGDITMSNADVSKNTVTLNCDVTLTDETQDFVLMLPEGSLQSGFTVKAYTDGDVEIYSRSTTDGVTFGSINLIQRSKIARLNEDLVAALPLTVTTIAPSFITKNSAKGLGMVDITPTQCGILYAKACDLIDTDFEIEDVNGTTIINLEATAGTRFDVDLTNLSEDEVYYVRAWAQNAAGNVKYGAPIPFATRFDYYSDENKGKSRYTFTVKAGTSVYFSMGNLQYQGSTSTWRFAENQFDYVGDATNGTVYEGGVKCNNASIAQNYSGWIDLFGWGTSGYDHGANCYQPWSISEINSDYYVYGDEANNLDGGSGEMQCKADWGYNAISNGENTQNSGWRTLQGGTDGGHSSEWFYLINTRTCSYRYAQVQMVVQGTSSQSVTTVNGEMASGTTVNGMIVFPDTFTWPSSVGSLATMNSEALYTDNMLSEAQWSLLEQAGAVFLPSTGYRTGTSVILSGFSDYWSSTGHSSDLAYRMYFYSGYVLPNRWYYRSYGFSVRLVCP